MRKFSQNLVIKEYKAKVLKTNSSRMLKRNKKP